MNEQRTIEMTRGMRLMEERLGADLEATLQRLYHVDKRDLEQTADELARLTGLAVNPATVSKWLKAYDLGTGGIGRPKPRKVLA